MSTKPGSLPTWDNTLANVSAITAGHQTNGFLANAIPTSGELNTLFNFYYLWCQYLSDGNFQGTATFSSTLGVTGLLTATGGVTAAAVITANAGVTVPTGQNITLAGTSTIKKGTRTRSFHPHQMLAMGSASQAPTYQQSLTTQLRTDFVTSSTNIAAALAINGLDSGDRILNVRVYLKDVSGQSALTCRLIGGDRAGSGAINGVSSSSAAGGTTQTITLTAVNHTIGTTSVGPVYVHISTATNATGTYSVFAVEIDYDTP